MLGSCWLPMSEWHIITGEYPPQRGGVSDYTQLVASGLAEAGDTVHVWCPPSGDAPGTPGVHVHRELGSIAGADLRRVGKLLDRFDRPRHLLVQWVPHAFGFRSLNVPLCLWLWRRAAVHGDRVDLMIHEPFLEFGAGSWRMRGAAAVHRVMMMVLLNAVRRVWVSTPDWEARARPFAAGRDVPFAWLPVPSNVPVLENSARVASIRARYAPAGEHVVGHFGTYAQHFAEELKQVVPGVLEGNNHVFLLLGRGSEVFRKQVVTARPELFHRVHATGGLSADDLSLCLSACDVMVQPYPAGLNNRHGTAMAALAHGRPMVTTRSAITEECWSRADAVWLAPAGDTAALLDLVQKLLASELERERLSAAAAALYRTCFDVSCTVNALRASAVSKVLGGRPGNDLPGELGSIGCSWERSTARDPRAARGLLDGQSRV